jgi:TPR repeat protein
MHRMLLGLVTGIALAPVYSVAEVQSTRACDLVAASPLDRSRPVGIVGVALDKIDAKVALPTCQAAFKVGPENPRLLYQIGRVFESIKDYDKARGSYEKASRLGNAPAQNMLGTFYEYGRAGLAKNDQEAARLYKLAADQGNAAAETNLGVFYRDGRGGLVKNDQEAARLYKLAADQGDPDGQANLGFFYEYGRRGLAKNDLEAARLYKLAAEQGNAFAQVALARFYGNGSGGVAKNDQEAVRLLKLAQTRATRMQCLSSAHSTQAVEADLSRMSRRPFASSGSRPTAASPWHRTTWARFITKVRA